MPEYTEPTQAEFDAAEQAAIDILSTKCPSVTSRAGSTVRELIVRPFAYLYAWVTSAVSSAVADASIRNLKASLKTENETADLIASNYFVERKQGAHAKGVVTVTTKLSALYLSGGTEFVTEDGVTLRTEKRVIATGGTYSDEEDTLYVPLYPVDTEGTFMANIPVTARESGKTEVAEGAPVSLAVPDISVLTAELTSAVTGGGDTETDAELMARAGESSAGAYTGSYYGLLRKLRQAPVDVKSIRTVAGDDSSMYRARYNTAGINPGGFVDCYVKTQDQHSVYTHHAQLEYSEPTSSHSLTLQDTECAGAYSVLGVLVQYVPARTFRVSFGSSRKGVSPESARLSAHQTVTVEFDTDEPVTSLNVTVRLSYMPGISALQSYLDSDENKFIGQSVLVKAAVPVNVRLDCCLQTASGLSDEELAELKRKVAETVNSYATGTRILNFSDVQEKIRTYNGTDLRLPCALSADMVLRDGSTSSFYSTSGLLSLEQDDGSGMWDSPVYFFSLIDSNIHLSAK